MLNEFRKSIQSVLYERISSPFSGAFFFSWCVWNWKLLYYLLFSDELVTDRITFVESHYINLKNSLLYPLASTVFLIVLFPFITTGAYWVWLKFKKWQYEIRNEIEKKQLITFEQSLELREQIRNQEIRFDKINQTKAEEVVSLKNQLSNLMGEKNRVDEMIEDKQKEIDSLFKTLGNYQNSEIAKVKSESNSAYDNEFGKILSSKHIKYYNIVIETITKGYTFNYDNIPIEAVSYFEAHEIIHKEITGGYRFTSKGLLFNKIYYDNIQ